MKAGLGWALCLLWACSSSKDSAGQAVDAGQGAVPEASPVAHDGGVPPVVSEPDDEIAFVYDPLQFRTFELRLAEADLAELDRDPTAERYVPGMLVFEGKEYGPVSIRYKASVGGWIGCTEGSTSENPFNIGGKKTCPKLSLKVSFDELDAEGRFLEGKKLQFHAMNSDDSLMRERAGYWLFRQMGVAAPRAVHVRVRINGKLAGVFLNVEYIDGRFTRSHFADGQGALFKEVWPGEVNPARLLAALRTNEDDDGAIDRMLAFGRALGKTNKVDAETLESWLNVDHTLRFIAVDRTIRADDGPFHFYCQPGGCGNHNFYVYTEEQENRAWLIPWDLDNAFVITGNAVTPADQFLQVIDEWDDASVACEPHAGGADWAPQQLPPSCDPLLGGMGRHFKAPYVAVLRELLDGAFDGKVLEGKIETWSAQIETAVDDAHASDPAQLSPTAWHDSRADFVMRTRLLRKQAQTRL